MMRRPWIIRVLMFAGFLLLLKGAWIPLKAVAAQWLLQDAWQQTLQDGGVHKPWPWADHWPVARLVVGSQGIDQIVLSGDSGHVLAFAPGHNVQSPLPGQAGTVLISGHRDTHFRFLKDLQAGTLVDIYTVTAHSRYRVRSTQVVDSTRTGIDVQSLDRQLVLVTCYPFDALISGGPQRFVVTADEV